MPMRCVKSLVISFPLQENMLNAFKHFDTDNSGTITRDEIIAALKVSCQGSSNNLLCGLAVSHGLLWVRAAKMHANAQRAQRAGGTDIDEEEP
jgi:Ca2+-binding EF-hand superfamily protein